MKTILHNRVKLMTDGERYWLANRDGSVHAILTLENLLSTGTCDQCGRETNLWNRHQRNTIIRNSPGHRGLNILHAARFCSRACRDLWWRAGAEKPLFQVD